MANKIKLKIDYKGVGGLLKGPETRGMMEEYGQRISGNAGEEYAYRTTNTGQRILVNIFPNSPNAAKDNLKNNTLLKALH